jgi:hypothetical protein
MGQISAPFQFILHREEGTGVWLATLDGRGKDKDEQ